MKEKRYRGVIFDLDGTLLDTLGDLTGAVNAVLRGLGLAEKTREEVCSYVGNGNRLLMKRALPEGASEEAIDAALAGFKKWYGAHDCEETRPYPGIGELLARLQAEGIRTAVVSNKYDEATRRLTEHYFPGRMTQVRGSMDGVPNKPAPDHIYACLDAMGLSAGQVLYVGDSEPDVETAGNAGLAFAGASWGFRGRDALSACGARDIFDTAEELLVHILTGACGGS